MGAFILDQSVRYRDDSRPLIPVFCADDNKQIIYGKQKTCRLIYWHIDFIREPNIGIGGEDLTNYYLNNGQWLIKQSNNFPQIRNYYDAMVCINPSNCQPLIKNQNYLLFIWGKEPTVIRVSNRTFEIFSDKQAESINKQKFIADLTYNIEYLNSVFETQLGKYINRPIRIIMLANNSDRIRDNGGSTLDHVILVNYYIRQGALAKD